MIDGLIDPSGRGPALWFQQMDTPRPQRNHIHLDIDVPHDAAAPAFWVLADAEGNEGCICTWQGRD